MLALECIERLREGTTLGVADADGREHEPLGRVAREPIGVVRIRLHAVVAGLVDVEEQHRGHAIARGRQAATTSAGVTTGSPNAPATPAFVSVPSCALRPLARAASERMASRHPLSASAVT